MVKQYLFVGFLFGTLFSTVIYALDKDKENDIAYVTGNDIKVVINSVDGEVAQGSILVKVDGQWHRFENSTYSREVSFE